MRLLVTGGAGFIGSNFVRRSLKLHPGLKITILDSFTYAGRISNLSGISDHINIVAGDICDGALVEKLVSEANAVVHFAAESHNDNSLANPKVFLETNVLGTYTLIQACVKFDVRFHHISTDEVFGDLPLESKNKFTRETPYNPSSPYSASKAASDHLVRAWIRSFGLRATISNCSNNYGPYQHEEKFIPRTILSAIAGEKPKIFGNGQNVRDWIHVDDHSDGIWSVLERGQIGQTYLLGANCEQSNIAVAKMILNALSLPPDYIEFVEDRPGHDLRYAIDSSATGAELGWAPFHKNFEQDIYELVSHYKALQS